MLGILAWLLEPALAMPGVVVALFAAGFALGAGLLLPPIVPTGSPADSSPPAPSGHGPAMAVPTAPDNATAHNISPGHWTWETDAHSRFTYISDDLTEHDRLRPNRFIGLTWTEAGFYCDETVAFDAMLATIAARQPFENFICQIDDHDQRRYRRASGRPIMAADGRFLGYRGVAADISAEIQSHVAADHARATLLDAIESISEGFVLLDAEDRFVLCNERARELIGPSGPLVAGMSFEEILRRGVASGHIVTDLPVDAFIADRLRRHRQAEGASEQHLRDGRWFRISERRTSDGGTVIIHADITADRQQAAALAKQIATLQATFDNMADGILITDADFRLVAWNRRFAELLDIPAAVLAAPGVAINDLVALAVRRGEYAGLTVDTLADKALAAIAKGPITFEQARPNGVILRRFMQRLPGGGVVSTYTDVTRRRQAEAALQASEERYRLLIEVNPDAVLVHRQGVITFANSAAARMLGVATPQELVGGKVNDLLAVEFQPVAADRLAQIEGGKKLSAPIEVTWQRTDGLTLTVESMSVVLPAQADGTPLILSVVRDVSQRHRIQNELQQAKEQAETANRSKTEFLANMGHELRTPLNAIIGFSEMIRDQLIGPVGEPRYIEYAKDINDSGHHLLSLINDLLDLSKAEAGKFVLNDEAVDIAAVLDACLKLVLLDAREDEVALHLAVPPLPPLRADPRLLKQVVINLLSNAEKFTPAGGRIDIDAALQDDGSCLIRVQDTGIGMAAQDIPRALEAFTQLENTATARRPGTGLGLPLSKRLVDLHGGHLRIDSAPGQGTTVSVLLPAERVLHGQPPNAGVERGRGDPKMLLPQSQTS